MQAVRSLTVTDTGVSFPPIIAAVWDLRASSLAASQCSQHLTILIISCSVVNSHNLRLMANNCKPKQKYQCLSLPLHTCVHQYISELKILTHGLFYLVVMESLFKNTF